MKYEKLRITFKGAFAGFGGKECYPQQSGNGTRLGCTLISNRAFVDENRRIGMYVMLTFLEANGIHMDCINEETATVGLSVANGSMSYEDLLVRVREHTSI